MMTKYRFIGPHNRHTETGAIVVHGQTVGIGQEFEADDGLIESLSDRFAFEKVASESKDVTIEAPQIVVKGRVLFPTEGR
jgi:hypothetical protein